MIEDQVEHELITDPRELEWRIFYSIVVAGKSAKFANDVVARWQTSYVLNQESLFDAMRELHQLGYLRTSFEDVRTGNYGKLTSAMSELIYSNIDLRTCSPEDLETIKGIGPKTSRFFILWTRPEAPYAALDVHILRWLGERHVGVPRTTPQSKTRYRALETLFLQEAERRGLTPRQLDWKIWSEGSTAANIVPTG